MDKSGYTAYQLLEIRGSLTYLMLMIGTTIIASSFQAMAQVTLAGILPPLLINLINILLAFIIYRRKKQMKSAAVLSWVLGFITIFIPIMAKYNYGIKVDWTFAAESYNSSILLVVFVAMLQLLFNKRLFVTMAALAFINWALFFFIAYKMGAKMYLMAMDGSTPIHGVVILREVFFILMSILLCYVSYRNIPVIIDYDRRTARQRDMISHQARVQADMTHQIKDKMGNLCEQVNEENRLIENFYGKMQHQAATFEQISATLEELLSSAENINTSSVEQLDGNVKMESIVNEFKEIKSETKNNLTATLEDMNAVVAQTNVGNEQLQAVESTIGRIREQSRMIAETVAMIVDIADRINLLSLNASIEAARAGEFGRGFAVVADEIGKLAFQTSESIKEIEKVLTLSTRTTEEGVEVIQSTAVLIKEMINRMSGSSDKIKVLTESIFVEEKYINIIIEQMFKNIDLARNIGISTEEQKNAIESTTKAIENINEIIAQMVGEIREMTTASSIILKNAEELMARAEEAVKPEH